MKLCRLMTVATTLLLVLAGIVSAEETTGVPEGSKNRGGLMTNYALVAVNNLQIGQTISMTRLAKMPLTIQNFYESPVFVTIATDRPNTPQAGYEPLPDLKWVTVEAKDVTVPAMSKIALDVIVKLPNDRSLLGRKIQANIRIKTDGDQTKFFNFGIDNISKFCFSIAPVIDKKAVARAMKRSMNADFNFSEELIKVLGATPGQKIQVVMPDGSAPILTNQTKTSVKVTLYAVAPKDKPLIKADPGSQDNTNPYDVMISPEELTLLPGESKPVKIEIQVPKDADLSKGSLFYLISVNNVERGIDKFLRIYLFEPKKETAPTEEAKVKE